MHALELQTDFLNDIGDATEEGLAACRPAARRKRATALQVQQLAVQTLGIVNRARKPCSVCSVAALSILDGRPGAVRLKWHGVCILTMTKTDELQQYLSCRLS